MQESLRVNAIIKCTWFQEVEFCPISVCGPFFLFEYLLLLLKSNKVNGASQAQIFVRAEISKRCIFGLNAFHYFAILSLLVMSILMVVLMGGTICVNVIMIVFMVERIMVVRMHGAVFMHMLMVVTVVTSIVSTGCKCERRRATGDSGKI